MKQTIEEKLTALFGALKMAERTAPDGRVGLDVAAMHLAIRTHREAATELVRRKCELAAAEPSHLQGAMMIASIVETEFRDDGLVNQVVSRGQTLETLHGEPQERKAAREWLQHRSDVKRGVCDACAKPFSGDEGYLLDGRYAVMPNGTRMIFGTEMLCLKCFWKHRYEPRDPHWRDNDDAAFL